MATKRTRLEEARAYHPRGRTVRDLPRPARSTEDEPRSTGKAGGGTGKSGNAGKSGGAGRAGATTRRPDRTGGSARTGTSPRAGGNGRGGATGRAAAPGTATSTTRSGTAGRSKTTTRTTEKTGARTGRPATPVRTRRPPKLANPRRRLRLATVLALAMFAALGIRLVELQLNDGPAYAATGFANRLQEVVLPAARGAVYDRNGAVLAHSVEARLVYADPTMVVNPQRVAQALQPHLGVPASELVERMRPRLLEDGRPSQYEWLARGVEIATATAIMELNLPGIGVHKDEARIVPGNDLAANVLGFTGSDLDNLHGLEGLEVSFEEVLRGEDGVRVYERGEGATADLAIAGGYQSETPPQPGSDLRLTLDMDVQYEVQRVLAERLRSAGASFGSAVLLDVATGDILALASHPTYNAADPQSAEPHERRDAGTAVVFDPGSAHKPIVFGAALQEGVVEPGDSLVVNPTIQKGDQTFTDSIWHPPGTRMSLSAIMAFSSNVGTIMVADELGSETLYEYQRAFGLGEATGVPLPGEATGALLPPSQWYGSSYGSIPIGHSVDVTALQMAAVYATIANDGVWTQPQLVQAVVDPDGQETPAEPPDTRQVLTAETATALRGLMEAVVSAPGGTGAAAAVEGYRVAGKTGTGALVVDGEYADGNVSSFIGMAPAENPRFVLAVSGHEAGTDVINGAFADMMGFVLQHYRVPPSDVPAPEVELYP